MIIKTTEQLTEFCKRLQKSKYIAVDTEFLREKTYYPILCLIQVATPDESACIDVLSELDLTPFLNILKNQKILKIFHSCRQDIEIFYNLIGKVPTPLFDTQVGAMVCGLGENVSYHNLVEHFLKIDIDKASRITDWSKRPLTPEQLEYAAYDVIYLIQVYPKMLDLLKSTKRITWLKEEMEALENPKLYFIDSDEAWLKVKPLSTKPTYLATLKALCSWREEKAKKLNRPRRFILKDDIVLQIAAISPEKTEDFDRLRHNDSLKKTWKDEIITAIKKALKDNCVLVWSKPEGLPPQLHGLQSTLKLLLDVVCAEEKVAPKMVASIDDINKLIINSDADIPTLKGWRRKIFGQKALDFKAGKIALIFNPKTQKTEWINTQK